MCACVCSVYSMREQRKRGFFRSCRESAACLCSSIWTGIQLGYTGVLRIRTCPSLDNLILMLTLHAYLLIVSRLQPVDEPLPLCSFAVSHREVSFWGTIIPSKMRELVGLFRRKIFRFLALSYKVWHYVCCCKSTAFIRGETVADDPFYWKDRSQPLLSD